MTLRPWRRRRQKGGHHFLLYHRMKSGNLAYAPLITSDKNEMFEDPRQTADF